MQEYVLTGSQIRSLARGPGDADAIALLTDAQLSRRRLFLLAAAERPAARSPDFRAVLTLVGAIDRQAPAAGRDLLRHPFLETWFAGVASDVTGESTSYLGPLAAATAARAGIGFELTLTIADTDLVLPGLGVAIGVGEGRLSLWSDGSQLRVAGEMRSVTVPAPFTAGTESWRPAFYVRLPALRLEVDDVDPLRGRFPEPPLDRIPPDELAQLGRSLGAAWDLLAAEQPAYAAGIRIALRTVVPLRTPANGSQVSASGRNCFGAIGLSPTDDPVALAELLLHESRHQTLDALLDLVELCRADGPARYHAPWRSDPRPADALMQGVYAFAGVAGFWRVRRRQLAGAAARQADFSFAYWREQVEFALAELLGSDELTDIGLEFFTELDSVLKGWREESEAAQAAWQSAVAARIAWRLAHHRVDQAQTEALSRAWRRGDQHARRLGEPSIVAGSPPEMRLSLLLREAWLAGTAKTVAGTTRERMLLAGDVAWAARMPEHPRTTRDWIEVATALTINVEHGDMAAHRRPELLRAVFDEVKEDGRAQDLIALDRWLTGAPTPGR